LQQSRLLEAARSAHHASAISENCKSKREREVLPITPSLLAID
jgi:hypothetical protein